MTARRMPRFQLTMDGLMITLPARTGIWKCLEFVAFYWKRHPFDEVEIAHVA